MRLPFCLAILAFVLGAVPALAEGALGIQPKVQEAAPEVKPPEKSPAGKPSTVKAARDAKKEPKAAAQKPAAKLEPAKAEASKSTPPKSADGKSETSAEALAGIPADQQLAIQSALLWSGDYTGSIGGDDPMQAAIKNYQKRSKAKITGELTSAERANLLAAAHDHEQEYGWSVVVDPATGIRIGLPTKLVPQARDAARGTRWSSAHGEVQVETFRVKTTDLAALFEQEKKEPKSRAVEYSVMHPDNFFISGMQGLKKFSVKAQLRDGEVRGFTMLYDQMMEGIVAPVMVAMASAFSPFPERSAPFAAPAKSVEYGTGLIVSGGGDIVTDRKLTHGCQVIVVKGLGDADRIAEDAESGLALLRVYGAHKLAPLPLANGAPKPGDVTLVGMPDPKEQDGRKPLAEIKARLTDGAAIELREPAPMAGFSGAAALDAGGKFLGMTEMRNAVLASAAPVAPPVRLVPAQTIRAFLEARDVAPTPAHGADARASVVRVICVRK
jgi:Trypsin-like peptidase domain